MLRAFRFRLLSAAAVFVLGGCSDNQITDPTPTPAGTREEGVLATVPNYSFQSMEYPPPTNVCGKSQTFDLTIGSKKVGTITVTNEASKLFVVYHTSAPYFISNTLLDVARTVGEIPHDRHGRALPWSFSYQDVQDPAVHDWYYTVFYSDFKLKAGDEVVLPVMAGVVYPMTSDWDGPWSWQQAWVAGTRINAKYAREQYVKYALQACGTGTPPPPPTIPAIGAGAVTVTFDDGFNTTYDNAYPVLREFGLRGNVAVNSQPVDEGWTDYMTLAQIRELHAAGWSVVNHTVSHPDLTMVTDAELARQIRDNKLWIERNGFRGSNVFVVPFHAWGARELAVARQYSSYARGYTVYQSDPAGFMQSYPLPQDRYGLTGFEPEFAPYTTAAGREQTRALVERAVRENKFVDIFFHKIPTENVPAFRELMKLLQPYVANIKPYHEIFPVLVATNN